LIIGVTGNFNFRNKRIKKELNLTIRGYLMILNRKRLFLRELLLFNSKANFVLSNNLLDTFN